MTQWARWLPESGWQVDVVCRHYGHDATPDRLAGEVHPNVRVHYYGPRSNTGDKAGEPTAKPAGAKAALRRWLEHTVVPDVGILGARKLCPEAERLAVELAPDVVLSSGPPHSIHWLGRRLADVAKAKWVADFRDPYQIDPRFRPRGWRRPLYFAHKRFERSIYQHADMTVHAIPLHGRWASRAYPKRKGPARVLVNGTPPDMAAMIDAAPRTNDPRLTSLRSVGYVAPDAPQLLAEAFGLLRSEGHRFEFVHAGRVPAGAETLSAEQAAQLRFLGMQPHRDALELVAGADMLLAYLSEYRSAYLGISSKLFEYLPAPVPILVINPTRPDRQLIRRMPGCLSLTQPTPAKVAEALATLAGDARGPTARLRQLGGRFDRREQAAELASWLNALV